MGNDPAPQSTGRSLLQSQTLTTILANSAAAVTVAGGLLYGLIALGYDRFYRTLGISPASVGITQPQIVARTATALALFASVLVAVYVFTYAVLSWFFPDRDAVTIALVSAVVLATLGPIVLGLTIAPVLLAQPFIEMTLTVTVVVLTSAILTLWLRRYATGAARKRAIGAAWIAVVAFIYFASVNFATTRMADLADLVIAGEAIPPAGLTFTFDVHADPVCVRELSAPAAGEPSSFYALFLGESGDWIALYAPSEHRTIRRDRNNLELSFIPVQDRSGSTC